MIINEFRHNIGLAAIPIAFNCSNDLATRKNLADNVLKVLDEAGTAYPFCTIEILEYIRDLSAGQIAQFKKLSDSGVGIAIDDFDRRVNGGEDTDPVLQKLKEVGVPILQLKVDGETTKTIASKQGYQRAEEIIRIAISYGAKSIVFEGGYHNLTTVTIAHIRALEKAYGNRIAFLVEGTVVDAVAEEG